MRRPDLWEPTKYVPSGSTWAATTDERYLSPASRGIADNVIGAYVDALRSHARGHLLDLGCGNVPLYGAYRDLVTEVTCADWAESAHESRHIDVEADLGGSLPFPDATFDTVLATDVLEHLPDAPVTLREIARIMRPTGVAIVAVPFLYWLHEEPHDYHRYTEHSLRRLAVEAGLGTVEVTPASGGLDVVEDLLAKISLLSPATRRHADQWSRLCEGMRLDIEADGTRARLHRLMPQNYVMVARAEGDSR